MFAFGSGVLIGTPAGANATPVNFGLVQEVTIDESSTIKKVFGQSKRAVAAAGGTISTTGKAKTARISASAFAMLYYGVALTPGQVMTAFGEAGAVPAESPYTVTVANSETWTQDQGVLFANTGAPLERVASLPATGQYSVAAGVYTFAAADTGKALLISYNYKNSTSGQSLSIDNPLLGTLNSFSMNLYGLDPTTGLSYTLQLYKCVSSKLSFGTKLEDFAQPEFDFEAFVNAAGLLGQWNFPDNY